MYSTAEDMIKFGQMFLNNGTYNGKNIKRVDNSEIATSIKELFYNLCSMLDKPLVVFFDEVDCLSEGHHIPVRISIILFLTGSVDIFIADFIQFMICGMPLSGSGNACAASNEQYKAWIHAFTVYS